MRLVEQIGQYPGKTHEQSLRPAPMARPTSLPAESEKF
jgi:hypothetical protein